MKYSFHHHHHHHNCELFSGSQQGLQGEAAYRLGLAYEMTGDGSTALLVSF